jgi:inactivated superfamily I helicase
MLKGHARASKTISRKDSDEFLSILINRQSNKLEKLVHELAKKNNPKLLSIIKVEDLFKTNMEFDSRSQLLRKLEGSMKAPVLNTIIARLVCENKLVVNDDHSLTWIDTQGNENLNKHFDTAVPF